MTTLEAVESWLNNTNETTLKVNELNKFHSEHMNKLHEVAKAISSFTNNLKDDLPTNLWIKLVEISDTIVDLSDDCTANFKDLLKFSNSNIENLQKVMKIYEELLKKQ